METQPTTVNESHEDTGVSAVVTIPPESLLPLVPLPPDNSALHSTLVTTPLNPIIDQIRKDNIAAYLLKYQLPAMIVAMAFTLISAMSGNYELTGKIMLVLLSLSLPAFITGKLLHDERPVIAAVAELVGILLIAVAFIYLLSVLLENTIICYLPSIFGIVAAGMYAYRLATASGGNTSGPSKATRD